MLVNILRMGVKGMGPDSFQWCPATGQGAMGTSWSMGSSSWRQGRTSSLWGWRSPGTGCPGRYLLLWRYSRPSWLRSCAACSGWPCFGRSLPTPNILWFCTWIQLCYPYINILCLIDCLPILLRKTCFGEHREVWLTCCVLSVISLQKFRAETHYHNSWLSRLLTFCKLPKIWKLARQKIKNSRSLFSSFVRSLSKEYSLYSF